MRYKYVIIGGGVAGLSAAIRLTELGEAPLVIEGGSYPSHKICGEFLSPECIPYLQKWGIEPVPVHEAIFEKFSLSFNKPAGALSHLKLDPQLMQYAKEHGATIKVNTRVVDFTPKAKELHKIVLDSKEEIEADHLIIATGKIPGFLEQLPLAYYGFKAHFVNSGETALKIKTFNGGYFGSVPIEENKINVACLAKVNVVGEDPKAFIEKMILLKEPLFKEWMISKVPEFGLKNTPDWQDVYFIGDAAATIMPGTGDGLSMAIIGARMGAEYAKQKDYKAFKKHWARQCKPSLFFANCLHKILMNPLAFKIALPFAPFLGNQIFKLTRIEGVVK